MRHISHSKNETKRTFIDSQPCVVSVRKANLPTELKNKVEAFIRRNVLEDCGRIPPNCLKAHMINSALKLKLPQVEINKIKNLFKSRVGYKGYYLDAGKLKKVEINFY